MTRIERLPMIVLWGATVVGCTIYEPPRAGYPPSAWQGMPPPQQPGAPPPYAGGGGGEFVQVPADRAEAVWTNGPLAAGVDYVVEASGVWSAWGDHMDGVDAYYGYGQWRVGNTPEFWNQLLLDDRGMADLAKQNGEPTGYNPAHVYTATIRGTGQRLKLQITDAKNGSWSDNHGGLNVRIYPRGGAPAYGYVPATPPAAPPPQPPPAFGGGDTVVVPADRGDAVWSNQPLAAGALYIIEASGVWSAWGDHQDGIDAYYAYAEWRVGRTPELWNQLLIDDRAMADLAKQNGDSVAYNPSHVYTTWLRGTGQRLKLQILDAKNGSAGDNHGALYVRISRR